ncbi:hypothetical protein DVK02_13690 [Halobellus sp. Atlit-31R]|nr:hypothetical protein DVK02_13690 [Halobellus sp. Atlit-31R]
MLAGRSTRVRVESTMSTPRLARERLSASGLETSVSALTSVPREWVAQDSGVIRYIGASSASTAA